MNDQETAFLPPLRLKAPARLALIQLGLLFLISPAAGQEKQTQKRDFEIPVKLELRFRPEARLDYDLSDFRDDDGLPVLQRFRLSLAPAWKSLRLFAQIQDSQAWNREKSNYTPADLHLYQFYVDAPVAGGFRFRAGRQELSLGEERVLGAFGWDNRGRSFDALTVYREGKTQGIRLFVANLPAPRERNRPRGQNLFGIASERTRGGTRLEVYGLWLHDQTIARGEERLDRTRIFTSGARFTRRQGPWSHSLESAWQLGRRNGDEHVGAAFAARSDYTWSLRRRPQAGIEYSFATGDDNPKDGKSREFHNLYPTNHPFYGFMDLFGWRNLHNLRLLGAIDLHRKMRLEVSYHEFWLARSRGAWRNAGGSLLARDLTGASGRRVGNEIDLTASCSIAKYWKILAGYSAFLPGRFARAARGEDSAQLVYLQWLTLFEK